MAGSLWRQRAPWLQHAGDVPADPLRLIRIALPFTGIDAPGRALHELGIAYEVDHMYEELGFLQAPVTKLYQNGPARIHPDGIHFGHDWLLAPHTQLRPVEGLVAGFPCPPWSSLGARLGSEDPRAACLESLLVALKAWSSKGLKWFILENVRGIQHHIGGLPSMQERLMGWFSEHMQDTLPACFAHMFRA